jgi:glucose/mannose-6-phosphate isomerase
MKKTMRQLVLEFPNQLTRSIEISKKSNLNLSFKPKNVFISGLGGSGIGATIVTNLVSDASKLPIVINKGYFLSKFVDNKSLVICCSYSGNTEETVHVLHQAFETGAKIVCITSGGKMLDFCIKNNIDYIQIDGGMPPRACLGYSMVQLVYVLTAFKVIKNSLYKKLDALADFLTKNQKEIDSKSKALANKIFDKIPVIYSEDKFEGVAVRYRQQINENSKMLCWHHVIPEMNHNEMVGWRDQNNQIAVLFLVNNADFERNTERKMLNEEVIKNYTSNIFNIKSKGRGLLEQSFYQIHFADLLSCHLAEIRGYDASEIDVINNLKGALDSKPIV